MVSKQLPPKERALDVIRNDTHEFKAKGYVFISHNQTYIDFVEQFKVILKRRGYAYWDYSESERDYHSALYRELEEKIEAAAAFMCVVTDNWRETEWPAAEYIYAKEAKVPVFVIQAKKSSRPVPIILNQQTRIDMATNFERGSAVLEHELDKKGCRNGSGNYGFNSAWREPNSQKCSASIPPPTWTKRGILPSAARGGCSWPTSTSTAPASSSASNLTRKAKRLV